MQPEDLEQFYTDFCAAIRYSSHEMTDSFVIGPAGFKTPYQLGLVDPAWDAIHQHIMLNTITTYNTKTDTRVLPAIDLSFLQSVKYSVILKRLGDIKCQPVPAVALNTAQLYISATVTQPPLFKPEWSTDVTMVPQARVTATPQPSQLQLPPGMIITHDNDDDDPDSDGGSSTDDDSGGSDASSSQQPSGSDNQPPHPTTSSQPTASSSSTTPKSKRGRPSKASTEATTRRRRTTAQDIPPTARQLRSATSRTASADPKTHSDQLASSSDVAQAISTVDMEQDSTPVQQDDGQPRAGSTDTQVVHAQPGTSTATDQLSADSRRNATLGAHLAAIAEDTQESEDLSQVDGPPAVPQWILKSFSYVKTVISDSNSVSVSNIGSNHTSSLELLCQLCHSVQTCADPLVDPCIYANNTALHLSLTTFLLHFTYPFILRSTMHINLMFINLVNI